MRCHREPGRGGRSSDPYSDVSAATRKDFAGILLSLYYSFSLLTGGCSEGLGAF